MHITWASNAPWVGSGYGGQTAQVVTRLAASGHEVIVAANHGLHGMIGEWEGIPVYPAAAGKWGNDLILDHHEHASTGPGWIVTLYDVWTFEVERYRGKRVASWVPVDHMPVPPEVVPWCREHYTIAMSRFGQKALQDAGVREVAYVPHALDLSVYRPTDTTAAGQTGRAAMGVPADAFVVMVAAANTGNHPPRKAWGQQVFAAAEFMRRHPDVHLYLHTDELGLNGVDLRGLIAATTIDRTRVHFVDQYAYRAGLIEQRDMAAMYSGADVLLFASMGEGFGLPAIEAQACGTPVIVSDFSAQSELAGPGWKIPVEPWWDNAQGAWLGSPRVGNMVAALEEAYAERGTAKAADRSQGSIAFAAGYDADLVFETYWRPVLADLERQLLPRKERRHKAA